MVFTRKMGISLLLFFASILLFWGTTRLDFPFNQIIQSNSTHWLKTLAIYVGYLGHGITLFTLSIGLWVSGRWLKDTKLVRTGIQSLIALLSTGIIVYPLKRLLSRPRPRLQWEEGFHLLGPSLSPGFDSFPSGHTFAIFALATVVAKNYPKRSWLFFLLASAVGFSRVFGGSHYLSDIVAGAILGYLTGLLVWKLLKSFL